jgi:hypothetical protein
MDRPINISAWEQNNGRSSDLHHDSFMDESERVAAGSPVASKKMRNAGEWSRLSNPNKVALLNSSRPIKAKNKLIKV